MKPLSKRELQVAAFLKEGTPDANIAILLGISVDGVKYHVKNILKKTESQNRTQAAIKLERQ